MNESVKGQLTVRGIVVGAIGCIIITAASVYTALRMGALPWPIVFAAIISLFFLKALSRGKATLNEANVTHTLMSAGAMVAGGLAFTLPGAWMLGIDIPWLQASVITIGGVIVGLIAIAALRRHFIGRDGLEFPIGEAAAQTLKASGGATGVGGKLFGAMGIAAVYGWLRDGLGLLPSILCSLPIPGVAFGIYNSPMMLAIGFLVGGGAIAIWFAGAVIGNFGINVCAPLLGFCDLDFATQITSCLGMGLMVGSGIGVIARDILPKGVLALRNHLKAQRERGRLAGLTATSAAPPRRSALLGGCALGLALCALLIATLGGLSPLATVITVAATFVTCAMSAQSVGQTGIDPMEIFGLIVLLIAAACGGADSAGLFLIAAFVAVACGLAGDVLNDFHAGYRLGTAPLAQWIAQAIGALIGAVVALVTMAALLSAYGPDAFGPGHEFVAAQASVVATMVSGIPVLPAFLIGIAAGFILFLFRFPSMMLGLGVYLPFYMSFTAFLGMIASTVYRRIRRRFSAAADQSAIEEDGLIVASGLLGGESIIGILLALFVASSALVVA